MLQPLSDATLMECMLAGQLGRSTHDLLLADSTVGAVRRRGRGKKNRCWKLFWLEGCRVDFES